MLRENLFDKATIFWRGIEVGVLRREFSVHLQGARLVLDLGCGEGEIARAVFGKKIKWGLDNDKEMVKKARKSGVYGRVLLADAGKIPLEDESVGLVFSNSVLEHIEHLDKVLREVFRVLKPGGKLVFTVPTNKLGKYLGWGRFYAFLFNKKYNHYHLYDLSGWKKILSGIDLKVVKSYYYLNEKDVKHWHRLLWQERLGGLISCRPPKVAEQLFRKTGSEPSFARQAGGGALSIVARKP